ncbi:MAG: hypothetical protein AABX54_05685 [Nanoarchaeota archaeon]
MNLQTKFEGRILTQISYEQAKENHLIEVGSCFAANLGHALFLMSKYCKEKELVKYYLIELKIENTNKDLILPTNQATMMIFKFYKE